MERVLAQFEEVTSVATATPGAAAWTAREPGTGRRVLIKRLAGEEAKTRATQALALRHPRIVPTRRWLRDEGGFYVVRDFIAGRNVRQALGEAAHRAFDTLQALLSPLIDALEYAHQLGLPHGGVTPENVLVAEGGGEALLCDWATSLVTPQDHAIPPTPHTDFAALCELYKEFLPTRPREDEAGQQARARLLRNLSEIQRTAQTGDELRYKLDAVARMAALLGFVSGAPLEDATPRQGARLVCAVSPPTATVNPGGGAAVTLSVRNEGDAPLRVEGVGSDVVWLNPAARFAPLTLAPDAGRDLLFALSGARLPPGRHEAHLFVRSNSGMTTLMPTAGTPWHEQVVTLPVLVGGSPAPPELGTDGTSNDIAQTFIGERPALEAAPVDRSGIACTQEPDPGLVRYGQNGVLHVGVQNVGPRRLRIDRLSTWPAWLVYPGDWQPLWIEPGATQYFGFSVLAQALTGGDYKAEVTLLTSSEEPTLLGAQTVWREMKCAVRVRVVRGAADRKLDAERLGAGCLPVLLALGSALAGVLALVLR
ncbi:MAG: hypothetical protein JO250_01840 [Armatimonadetes bacterium]|nr:hypothetical protein [Armatimonadota bacterium]